MVVPAHRMDHMLARCLEALEGLDYPAHRREVMVICDGVEPGRFFDGLDVSVVATDRGGPARARNLGIRQAAGELVAFTDSDCLVHLQWVRRRHRRRSIDLAHPRPSRCQYHLNLRSPTGQTWMVPPSMQLPLP